MLRWSLSVVVASGGVALLLLGGKLDRDTVHVALLIGVFFFGPFALVMGTAQYLAMRRFVRRRFPD
jgi:hypothetical protein